MSLKTSNLIWFAFLNNEVTPNSANYNATFIRWRFILLRINMIYYPFTDIFQYNVLKKCQSVQCHFDFVME